MKADKTLRGIAYAGIALFAGTAIAGAIKRKREQGTSGIGAVRKFYVYAGYYENYISSKPMPRPYVLRRTFRSINRAIDYAESFGDTVIYCDNVKYDLPDYMREALEETNEFFTYKIGKVNPNRKGTRVIFKKFPNREVIAFFPDIVERTGNWGRPIECMSYMHMGQHGGADYALIHELKPATPQEYAPLLRELKQIGYDDLIITHRV